MLSLVIQSSSLRCSRYYSFIFLQKSFHEFQYSRHQATQSYINYRILPKRSESYRISMEMLALGRHKLHLRLAFAVSWGRHDMETFLRYWHFVKGNYRSKVDSSHKRIVIVGVFFVVTLAWRRSWKKTSVALDCNFGSIWCRNSLLGFVDIGFVMQ